MKNKVSNFKNVIIACEHEEKIQNDIGIHFPPLQYCLVCEDPSGTYFKIRKAEIHNLNKKDEGKYYIYIFLNIHFLNIISHFA